MDLKTFFSENKEKQKILREEALNKYREQEEEMKKKKSELKHELGRFSVKEQMKVNLLEVWSFINHHHHHQFTISARTVPKVGFGST